MTGFAFPDISPVIFSIGPVAIRWYSMAYLVGIVAAWWLASITVKKYKMPFTKQHLEDLVFYCTLGVIFGGRLGYVFVYGLDSFLQNPLEVFAIWNGGMSFHGGIAGVMIALWLFAAKFKFRFLEVTDLVVLYVPIGIFLGRIANFINDELWGRETNVSWAVRFPRGGYVPRHPSQLYEAFFEGLVMFVIINLMWRSSRVRRSTGLVSAMFGICYGTFRMSMEQFREPDVQMGYYFGILTMGQLLSLPLIIAGLIVAYRSLKLSK